MLEFLLNHKETLDGDLDFRLVLSTTPTQLLEVVRRLWEVLEPYCELGCLHGLHLLLDGCLAIFFISDLFEALFEPFAFFELQSAQRHRKTG